MDLRMVVEKFSCIADLSAGLCVIWRVLQYDQSFFARIQRIYRLIAFDDPDNASVFETSSVVSVKFTGTDLI